jgi:glyoxalase family protein
MVGIASDGPGFTVDEDSERLGEQVASPLFLERSRAEIVANLKPTD